MKQIIFPALAAMVLFSVPAFAMKNGVVKFLNEAKGFSRSTGDFSPTNKFSFEIDGISLDGVKLVEETQVMDGGSASKKLTVTKDWSSTDEFYEWRKAVLDGKVERKSVSIIFHNDAGDDVGRADFYECFPTRLSLEIEITDKTLAGAGSDTACLNARNSGHASEKLELSCAAGSDAAKAKHETAKAVVQNIY